MLTGKGGYPDRDQTFLLQCQLFGSCWWLFIKMDFSLLCDNCVKWDPAWCLQSSPWRAAPTRTFSTPWMFQPASTCQLVSNLDPVEDLVDKVHPRVLLLHLSRLVSVHNVPHLGRVKFGSSFSLIKPGLRKVIRIPGRSVVDRRQEQPVLWILSGYYWWLDGCRRGLTDKDRGSQEIPDEVHREADLQRCCEENGWVRSGKPERFNLTTWRWWTELPLSLSHSRLQSNLPPANEN